MNLIRRSKLILSIILLQATIHSRALAATCYYRENSTVAEPSFQPCNPSQEESACCALNKTDQAPNDICLSNGLCYSEDSYNSGMFFQSACTDKTWGSALCPTVCKNVAGE